MDAEAKYGSLKSVCLPSLRVLDVIRAFVPPLGKTPSERLNVFKTALALLKTDFMTVETVTLPHKIPDIDFAVELCALMATHMCVRTSSFAMEPKALEIKIVDVVQEAFTASCETLAAPLNPMNRQMTTRVKAKTMRAHAGGRPDRPQWHSLRSAEQPVRPRYVERRHSPILQRRHSPVIHVSKQFDGLPPVIRPYLRLNGHRPDDVLLCVAFSPDNTLIASSTASGEIFSWTVATQDVTCTYRHASPVPVVAVAWVRPDALAAQFRDGHIYFLRVSPTTSATMFVISQLSYASYSMCRMFHTGGKLFVPSANGTLEMFTITANGDAKDRVLFPAPPSTTSDLPLYFNEAPPTSTLLCLAVFAADYVLCGYSTGHVLQCNFATRQWQNHAAVQLASEAVTCVAVCDSVRLAACGSSDGSLHLLHISPSGVLSNYSRSALPKGLSDVAFRPDGKVLVTVCWDGCVRVLDVVVNCQVKHVLAESFASGLNVIAFQCGGCTDPLAAVGSPGGEIILWKV